MQVYKSLTRIIKKAVFDIEQKIALMYLRKNISQNYTGNVLTFNNGVQVRFGNTSPFGAVGHLKIEADGSQMLFDMGASWVLRDNANSSTVRFTFVRSTGDFITGGYVRAAQFRLNDLNTPPVLPSSAGVKGTIRFTADYIYFCIADNTWVRAPLTTW